MPTTYTGTLSLPKHDPKDPFDVTLINNAEDLIDAAVARAFRGRAAFNWLENADFSINQRLLTTYEGAAQGTVDRWKTTNADTKVEVLTNGIRLTNTVAGSGGYLQQTLENPSQILGKTMTFAAMQTDGTLSLATATLPSAFPSAITQYATISDEGVTVGAIQMSSNSAWVRVWSNPSETTRSFRWAALYEGAYTAATLPAFVPQRPAADRLECQRHFVPLNNTVRYPLTRIVAGSLDFLIPLPTKMRVSPSLTGGFAVMKGSEAVTGFAFSVAGMAEDGVAIRATKAGHGLTAADGLYLQVDAAALSAEL